MRSDLNDPNKKINDILADLAADNKYDGDGTQTVEKLTQQHVDHIKANSEKTKLNKAQTDLTNKQTELTNKQTELTNKQTELNNVADLLASKITQDLHYVESGELLFDVENVNVLDLVDTTKGTPLSFTEKAVGSVFENSIDNTKIHVMSKTKIGVEVPTTSQTPHHAHRGHLTIWFTIC